MTVAILCPVTSRGCSKRVLEQPLFNALLPSMDSLQMWGGIQLVLGFDNDDPIWNCLENRQLIRKPVKWVELFGLSGNITAIWRVLANQAEPFDYLIPANDDLAFQTSPLPAVDSLAARRNFGTVAFHDYNFPDLPTFFMVGRVHFAIFGTLYPLPWKGAHQDSWIFDVYAPWGASAVDPTIKCANHLGTGPRFEYGPTDQYEAAVEMGRRTVNDWLKRHPEIAEPVSEEALYDTPLVIKTTR